MIELEEIANRESKTLGMVTTLLFEWGYEQLKGVKAKLVQVDLP